MGTYASDRAFRTDKYYLCPKCNRLNNIKFEPVVYQSIKYDVTTCSKCETSFYEYFGGLFDLKLHTANLAHKIPKEKIPSEKGGWIILLGLVVFFGIVILLGIRGERIRDEKYRTDQILARSNAYTPLVPSPSGNSSNQTNHSVDRSSTHEIQSKAEPKNENNVSTGVINSEINTQRQTFYNKDRNYPVDFQQTSANEINISLVLDNGIRHSFNLHKQWASGRKEFIFFGKQNNYKCLISPSYNSNNTIEGFGLTVYYYGNGYDQLFTEIIFGDNFNK